MYAYTDMIFQARLQGYYIGAHFIYCVMCMYPKKLYAIELYKTKVNGFDLICYKA